MKTLLIMALLWIRSVEAAPKHYVYFEMERHRIQEPDFLASRFEGAQLKYTWAELEPLRDQYDFSAVEQDLTFLQSHGKKLWIQVQDLSFNVAKKFVPPYLVADPQFNGGVNLHYLGEGAAAVAEGWIARRWDPAVAERFHRLIAALGRAFDGRLGGINLPETAFAYGDRPDLMPPGFSPLAYRNGILSNLAALAGAFRRSPTLQYANFMPGEWLPDDDQGHLKSIFAAGVALGVGLGGPDLLPYRKGQLNHAYALLPTVAGKVPTGIAAQWDNYTHVNPSTGQPVPAEEMAAFATQTLGVDYLFWCTQEPYFSRDVVPLVNAAP